MTPQDREAWSTWLSRHHIDPYDVVVGYPIICDDVERRVYWTSYQRDEDGHVLTHDGEALKEQHFVQLEAPALPMPDYPLLTELRRLR